MSRHLPVVPEVNKLSRVELNLGKAVTRALAKRSMSQLELASRLGISKSSMSRIANNAGGTIETINHVAMVLGMKPSELIALGEE